MSESGKNIGKLVTCLGGLGLALLRVKEMYVYMHRMDFLERAWPYHHWARLTFVLA